jgi:Glyoxalase-like domain
VELDHVFCMVDPDGDWAVRLERAGWSLDAGTRHEGQGTRNRRLAWRGAYLELVWVVDEDEARANPLRLDRRAGWQRTGASPFGIGLRGELPEAELSAYWRYDALGLPIWVHRDNDDASERPLVFVLEMDADAVERRRARIDGRGALRSVVLRGPSPPAVPRYDGPPIAYEPGAHHVALRAGDGPAVAVTELLDLVG